MYAPWLFSRTCSARFKTDGKSLHIACAPLYANLTFGLRKRNGDAPAGVQEIDNRTIEKKGASGLPFDDSLALKTGNSKTM